MLSTYLSAPANTSLWLIGNSGVSPGPNTEVLGPDVRALAWLFCALPFGGVCFVVSWGGEGGGGGECGDGYGIFGVPCGCGDASFSVFQD
jgi:hypothetical protein